MKGPGGQKQIGRAYVFDREKQNSATTCGKHMGENPKGGGARGSRKGKKGDTGID